MACYTIQKLISAFYRAGKGMSQSPKKTDQTGLKRPKINAKIDFFS
jgi:hypothetical protein